MTPKQIAIAKCLGRCSLPLAAGMKSFVRNMAYRAEHSPGEEISDKQDTYLHAVAYRFRRQLPADLLAEDEQPRGKMTTLQWLAPEMARAGLLKNDPWVTAAADAAEALFPNHALRTCAVLIAALHPHAIDYINQAPVLVMAASHGGMLHKIKDRQEVARRLKPLLDRGPKLREMMGAFGLPLPLRGICAWALAPSRWGAIQLLAKVPPSTLAQSIPEKATRQASWLNVLSTWEHRMRARFDEPYKLATWAAMHLAILTTAQATIDITSDLADFAGSPGVVFNERWSYAQALAAAQRWHAELARKSNEEQFFARNGLAWDQPIDYGGMPTEYEATNGLKIMALRSGAEIYEEGVAMHHCVASYTQSVVAGKCRLFSVRKGDERIATFELRPNDYLWASKQEKMVVHEKGTWLVSQMKGPCNAVPSVETKMAIRAFLKAAGGKEIEWRGS